MATPTSKRTRSEYSASTSTISPEKSYTDVLDSINKKLTSLDARLAVVEVLSEVQPGTTSLTAENQALRDS
ncbi:hypothetical protein CRENBAI_014133, partial [Crenichthys baileyi]